MSAVLAVMTRSTSDPRIKTRLAPLIPTEEGRRNLSLGFIDDVVDRCRALPDVALRLAVTPPVESLRFDRPALAGETLLAQRGASLPDRQRHVFEDLASSGFTTVVLIGSDTPDVPLEYLDRAFEVLRGESPPVVLGPSDNGGCYLIGTLVRRGAVPDLFSGVRWATPHTLDDLTHAATAIGLPVHLLETWNAVVAPGDLTLMADRLRYTPEAAPNTAAVLRRLGLL